MSSKKHKACLPARQGGGPARRSGGRVGAGGVSWSVQEKGRGRGAGSGGRGAGGREELPPLSRDARQLRLSEATMERIRRM